MINRYLQGNPLQFLMQSTYNTPASIAAAEFPEYAAELDLIPEVNFSDKDFDSV